MKKVDLIKRLSEIAKDNKKELTFVRQGKHEVWAIGTFTFPIPRHNEIDKHTAQSIINKAMKEAASE